MADVVQDLTSHFADPITEWDGYMDLYTPMAIIEDDEEYFEDLVGDDDEEDEDLDEDFEDDFDDEDDDDDDDDLEDFDDDDDY